MSTAVCAKGKSTDVVPLTHDAIPARAALLTKEAMMTDASVTMDTMARLGHLALNVVAVMCVGGITAEDL
jgi:hypothetical protein